MTLVLGGARAGKSRHAEAMIEFSGLNEKADAAGFVAVYPEGTGRLPTARTFNGGNCCGYAQNQQIDDVRFVDRLLRRSPGSAPPGPERLVTGTLALPSVGTAAIELPPTDTVGGHS